MKEQINLSVVPTLVKVIPAFTERKVLNREWVLYGEKNDFPKYLWDLYLKSAVLQSIINGTTEFISGNKIIVNSKINELSKNINKHNETIEDLIQRLTVDYFIFGGFAMQIIYNGRGEISELYWLDFQNIRSNEDGTKYFYNENWKKTENAQPYRAFDPSNNKGTCIFYYKGNKTRGVYPIPSYVGALTAIETSTEISKFHLNNILNNLETSSIISFNNGTPSEEEQRKIEEKLKNKFAGAENAGRFIVTFNDSKENAVTVQRLKDDQFDKKFDALRSSTLQEIFIGFRALPVLFGGMVDGQLFNKQEFQESYALYHRNVVYPTQRMLIRVFDRIFNIENSIEFEHYTLLEEDVNNQNAEEGNNENE